MLFEDLDTLNEMIDLIRTGAAGGRHSSQAGRTSRRFRDLNDPEIDRLYSTSPPESEQVGTFDMDNSLLSDFDNDSEAERKEKKNPTLSPSRNSTSKSMADLKAEYRDPQIVFRKQETSSLATAAAASTMSSLSMLLNNTDGRGGSVTSTSTGITSTGGGAELTVYLPNSTVDAVIKNILAADKSAPKPTSSLHHHAPECYELRLHEGDGEPDEDFPALDRKRMLKQFGNVSEYCLCRKNNVPVPDVPSDDKKKAHSSAEDTLPPDMIMVMLPNSGHMKVRLESHTKSRDLISLVAKTHRLKLYTVDYVCCMTEEDQRRLKFFSPLLDPNEPILKYGIKKVELQQRVYADSSHMKTLKRIDKGDLGVDSIALAVDNNMMFTDITAAVYQEWNVVKKNKFGRMQERVLGIDGSHLYNSRRTGRGQKSGVMHAVRDINTVVEVHNVVDDPTSFRVTFDEEREIFDIVYTCDNPRECFEITSKLRYLLSTRNKAE